MSDGGLLVLLVVAVAAAVGGGTSASATTLAEAGLLLLEQPLLLIGLHGVGDRGEGHHGRLARVPRVHHDLRYELTLRVATLVVSPAPLLSGSSEVIPGLGGGVATVTRAEVEQLARALLQPTLGLTLAAATTATPASAAGGLLLATSARGGLPKMAAEAEVFVVDCGRHFVQEVVAVVEVGEGAEGPESGQAKILLLLLLLLCLLLLLLLLQGLLL